MDGRYSNQIEKATTPEQRPPRARCIVEWIEGDVSRPPVVYPQGGDDEIDAAMCDVIRRRWEARS